jgi:hypothetical protein
VQEVTCLAIRRTLRGYMRGWFPVRKKDCDRDIFESPAARYGFICGYEERKAGEREVTFSFG